MKKYFCLVDLTLYKTLYHIFHYKLVVTQILLRLKTLNTSIS
jgi:hypothetical protein